MKKTIQKKIRTTKIAIMLGSTFLFSMLATTPTIAKANIAGAVLNGPEHEIHLAAVDPKKALFDTLKKAGKSFSFIAGELKKKFKMSQTAIAKLFKQAGVSATNTVKAMRTGLKTTSNTAANIIKNIFKVTNKTKIANTLRKAGYSLTAIAKTGINNLKMTPIAVLRWLKSAGRSDNSAAKIMRSAGVASYRILSAGASAFKWSAQKASTVLRSMARNLSPKQFAKVIRQAGYKSQQSANQLAKFLKNTFKLSKKGVEDALKFAGYSASRIAAAIQFVFGAVVAKAQAMGKHFVGPASGCRSKNYGNKTNLGIGKFKNFKTLSSYQDINSYLLMQASNKTYYKQFRYGSRVPRTEGEFRCAANELYRHWGFTKVYFVNSTASANAIIASNSRMVLITFRGTQDPSKGITNSKRVRGVSGILVEGAKGLIDIAATVKNDPVPFVLPTKRGVRFGRMHAGYAAVTTTLIPLVQQALKKMRVGTRKIYVTGHSLGASTAVVTAFALKLLNHNVNAAYVYAPPKVGDLAFAKSIKKTLPVYTIVNYRDPVPTIPLYTNINLFVSVMDASRKSVYFKKDHKALVFSSNTNPLTRTKMIVKDQELPPPILLLRGGGMSDEWKFHHGNFYTAFTFARVPDNFKRVPGTSIAPEFTPGMMCMNGKERRDIGQYVLLGDKHRRPVYHGKCKSLSD